MTKVRVASWVGRSFFIIFSIIIPLVTIHAESGFRSEGGWRNPLPHPGYYILVILVPIAYVIVHMIRLPPTDRQSPRALAAGIVLTAYALLVSFVYTLLYPQLIPMGILLIPMMGMGLMGLAPLFALLGGIFQMRFLCRAARMKGMTREKILTLSGLGLIIAAAFFGALEGLVILRHESMSEIYRADRDEMIRLVEKYRGGGMASKVLDACQGHLPEGRGLFGGLVHSDEHPDREEWDGAIANCRELYYRLTGTPHHLARVPRSYRRSRFMGGMGWTSGNRGSRRFGTSSGLRISSSFLTLDLEPGPGIGNIDWTLAFFNGAERDREARCEIEIPVDAVATGLSLWINGVEEQAAFGGAAQVKNAYEAVTRTRRDPAVLTAPRPGMLTLECFPVPAGGEMKLKMRFAIPLKIRGENAFLTLPRIIGSNYHVPEDFEHYLYTESEHLTGILGGNERTLPSRDLDELRHGSLVLPRDVIETARTHRAELGSATARMTWSETSGDIPRTVILVVDGSKGMDRHDVDWTAFHAAFGNTCRINALEAGLRVESWKDGPVIDHTGLAEWLDDIDFEGGCDPVPALMHALDAIGENEEGVILWIHELTPVTLSSAEPLMQRLARRKVSLLSLCLGNGIDRIAEKLWNSPRFTEIRPLGSLDETLRFVAGRFADSDWTRKYELFPTERGDPKDREGLGAGGDSGDADRIASDALVKLAVREKVMELIVTGDRFLNKDAESLARSTRIVTPVSGAVVLETDQQYEEHDLDPLAPEDPFPIPPIPEPEEWALMIAAVLALGGLVMLRRR